MVVVSSITAWYSLHQWLLTLYDVQQCISESITFKRDMALFEMLMDPDFCHFGTNFVLIIAHASMLFSFCDVSNTLDT